jgi:bacillithiol biosynthesis cysteine-adding enzyme BshC
LSKSYSYLPYTETGYFSRLVNDYTSRNPGLEPFYEYTPDVVGIARAISERRAFPVDRQRLVTALSLQYSGVAAPPAVLDNIQLLLEETTYTVTTAHQPNLLTGYLYFIYKILHAIKLTEELNRKHPGKHFVPVYYMGSEDNDIEELGVFRYGGEQFVWDGNGQSGAVGRMSPAGLKPLIDKLFRVMGPPGDYCDRLKDILSRAYLSHATIGAATRFLVNELFGAYGLVVLDPDDATLKAAFIPVMEDELLHGNTFGIVNNQTVVLEQQYKAQMFPRPVNLFYLADQIRERIERQGDKWIVLNTQITFDKSQIISELHANPDRFSPNVALRGLYQETLLPNVAFIGGGAEVAYWFQLKPLFNHYNVFYPPVLLRQSVLWITETALALRKQIGLRLADIFLDPVTLERNYVATHSETDWQTGKEKESLEAIMNTLAVKAAAVDPTLGPSANAALAKMRHQLVILEQKMLRAEKRKLELGLRRIERLKKSLFPSGSLQERTENFAEYYLTHGAAFFDTVKDGILPLSEAFLIIE